MPDTLEKIYTARAATLEQEREREPYDSVRERALARAGERRAFRAALEGASGNAIVAEIKRASPSAGLIARSFDVVAIGRAYDAAGSDAISVLTERDHFLGELSYLDAVRTVTRCPLLRKDFMWTRYQVAQSAAYGADCVLLIVGGMDDATLRECMDEAANYALDVLAEVHDEDELRRAVAAGANLVGINNRNLRTLETDLAVSEHLLPKVPARVFAISESGMRDASDVARLRAAGARGFLIGEALMQSEDPKSLIGTFRRGAAAHAVR
ncbi:MAG: indole-3-glycerol phosphate synthase TrpC [Candidatus Eremiobacteraeota bacterium]|nr:indole-3-glycerol phosphate synthase TrpC [Candidatus Eremiobacteraeota bacterium]MBV8498715.1 indole-3-glycerol phosphate synthase TrpC [Candidatus Eremiobacteraeota bacterium]